MDIDFAELSAREAYGFMVQAIVPRPVAWVLSDNGTGNFNLAPFSFFNGVTSRPPTLSISIGKKRDGAKKDTWRNIEERSHFVVHIAGASMAKQVSDTSASLTFGESEVDRNQIELTPVDGWSLPRVRTANVAMLCERYRIVEIGDGPQGLIIGRILRAYVDDAILAKDGDGEVMLLPRHLDPLARLGGDSYASLEEPFEVERPA